MAESVDVEKRKDELKKILKEKQVRFAEEYLIDLNGTQAAIRTGYAVKSAGVQALRMDSNVYVKEYIEILKAERSERTKVTADEVLQYWAKIMRADIRNFVTFDANGFTIKNDEEIDGTLISEISETSSLNGGSKKIKLKDGLKASENVAKHLGMLIEKKEVTGKNGGPVVVRFGRAEK